MQGKKKLQRLHHYFWPNENCFPVNWMSELLYKIKLDQCVFCEMLSFDYQLGFFFQLTVVFLHEELWETPKDFQFLSQYHSTTRRHWCSVFRYPDMTACTADVMDVHGWNWMRTWARSQLDVTKKLVQTRAKLTQSQPHAFCQQQILVIIKQTNSSLQQCSTPLHLLHLTLRMHLTRMQIWCSSNDTTAWAMVRIICV